MKTTHRSGLLCALVVGTARLFALESPAPAPRVPLEDFFAEDDARGMQLSPDGHHAAFLTTLGWGKVGIAMFDLAKGGPPEPLVSAQDENIKWFFWKGSEYIVYGGDLGGEEVAAWRAIAVAPPKPGEKRMVRPLSEAYRERYQETDRTVGIIDSLKYDPYHLLVEGHNSDWSSIQIMKLDVRTGLRSPVDHFDPVSSFEGQVETTDFVDNHGDLRARQRVVGDKIIYEVRATPASNYVKVAEFPAINPSWRFLFFASDNESLYLVSNEHTDMAGLHTFNVRTRELSPVIFQADDGEEGGLLMSWDRSKLYGVRYNSDKPHYQFFDAGREKLQRLLDQALPATFNEVVGTSQDEKIKLVLAWSDRDPGTYYVLDLPHGRLGALLKVKTRIKPEQMRPMEPVSFQARDGLTVHGYLTRPAIAPGEHIPLIIHPHGGPYGIRDEWGFDPEVQFLANRGFAVLQINYRGSGGYGLKFEQAGYKEWGGKMQDDLTDGAHWALDQGFVDPRRVAIYGASYGGYATLMGLASTPELYCCGVNYVGVADLNMLVRSKRSLATHGADLFYLQCVGADREYLRTRSPVNFVERIQVPLLNAYGYNDPRVDFQQWKALESKLKEYKKTYEIVSQGNEGHGFYNESNRIDLYRHMEAFLDKYLRNGATAGGLAAKDVR